MRPSLTLILLLLALPAHADDLARSTADLAVALSKTDTRVRSRSVVLPDLLHLVYTLGHEHPAAARKSWGWKTEMRLWPDAGATPARALDARLTARKATRAEPTELTGKASWRTIEAWLKARKLRVLGPIKGLGIDGQLRASSRLVLASTWSATPGWKTAPETRSAAYRAGRSLLPHSFLGFRGKHLVADRTDCRLVVLHLKGGMELLVVVPKTDDGLAAVRKGLTGADLQRWRKDAERQETAVWLPKIEVSCGAQPVLQKRLEATSLESFMTATFRAIDGETLRIGFLAQGGALELTDAGVHVAAATVCELHSGTELSGSLNLARGGGSAARVPARITEGIVADRPFLLALRHGSTGAILALTVVIRPYG